MLRKSKILFALLSLSLFLRIGASVFTEYHPIFPSYYYTDAKMYESMAWEIASEWKELNPVYIKVPYHYYNYERMLAPVYMIFGHHKILLKFYNVAASILAIYLLFLVTEKLSGYHAGVILLAIMALWPSHIYWSSQILRESLVWFGLGLIMYGGVSYYASYKMRYIFLFSAGLLIVGLLRIQDLLPLLVFLLLPLSVTVKRFRNKVSRWLLFLIPILSVLTIVFSYVTYLPVYALKVLNINKDTIYPPDREITIQWSTDAPCNKFRITCQGVGEKWDTIAEVSGHENTIKIPPFQKDFGDSPVRIKIVGCDAHGKKIVAGMSNPFYVTNSQPIALNKIERKYKNENIYELFAEKRKKFIDGLIKERPPASLLFPEYEFHSYSDIIKFIPKSAFYVLFMPLPGLYPLGKLGTILSSVENIILLILTIIAFLGIFKMEKDLRHYLMLASLMLFIIIHSFIEPDLGSATRHKPTYFPLIFIFSSWFIAKYFKKETCKVPLRR